MCKNHHQDDSEYQDSHPSKLGLQRKQTPTLRAADLDKQNNPIPAGQPEFSELRPYTKATAVLQVTGQWLSIVMEAKVTKGRN